MLCTSLDVIKEEREDGKKCIEWNIKRVINKKCVSVWYF
jgi:hypothetical protein